MLRAAVIIDYQNVHMTGAGLHYPNDLLHQHVIHPVRYAERLISERNSKQRDSVYLAEVTRILVQRGLPSPEVNKNSYNRNQSQKAAWESDPRVKVTHRPLRYNYEYDDQGKKLISTEGIPVTKGKPAEKGIDVLCALELVRCAASKDIDLVILCSQDTDLEPALDMALEFGSAKIETASWYAPGQYSSREIHATNRSVWNTRMDFTCFDDSCEL